MGFLRRAPHWRAEAPAPLHKEPFLVPQQRWELVEPVEDLLVVVDGVASEAKHAGGEERDDGDHGMHARHQEAFVPGQAVDGLVGAAQVLPVALAVRLGVGGGLAAHAALAGGLAVGQEAAGREALAHARLGTRRGHASLWPLAIEDAPLFVARGAVVQAVALQELEVLLQPLQGRPVVQAGQRGRRLFS